MATKKISIEIPYGFTPREYQKPFFEARNRGMKRFVICAHRRSGKDKTGINFMIKEMVQRVGSYYYILPTFAQGRKIVWEGIDKDGFKFLDHFPKEIMKSKNDTEMKIELVNGSILRVIGSDNYDSIVGTNPIGAIFSEYALQNPRAWDYLSPIFRENGGWAAFVSTPRGHNHFWDILQTAKKMENDPVEPWFYQVLTIEDTGVVSQEMLDLERKAGRDEDFLLQEYYCSFEASIKGAYYSEQMKACRKQERICRLPVDLDRPVHTAWDIGRHDSNAIWFFQIYGKEIRFIDYDERNGESLKFFVRMMKDKGYTYGMNYFPHDVRVTDYSAERSRIDLFQDYFRDMFGKEPEWKINKRRDPQEGIEAVRSLFDRFWFDEEKCRFGIEALTQYAKEYDEEHNIFRSRPAHSWASHCADAMRTMADGYEEEMPKRPQSRSPWVYMGDEFTSAYEV